MAPADATSAPPRNPDFLATLLYYFGVLTLAGRDALGKLQLAIPNQVIRKLYVERLQEQLLPRYEDQEQRQAVVERFYATGDLGPLCDLLEQTYFKRDVRLFEGRWERQGKRMRHDGAS